MNPEELDKLTDEELKLIALKGENLHRPNSRASIAVRILEIRTKYGKSKEGQENGEANNQS